MGYGVGSTAVPIALAMTDGLLGIIGDLSAAKSLGLGVMGYRCIRLKTIIL